MAEHIDGPLHYACAGDRGTPILFAHPNPMDHTCWLFQVAHLRTWFRTIAVDLPGYGLSPTARPGLTMADVGQACWEAVDRVTEEPAVLVGLSVGATVVNHMAVQRPDRTLALVMAGRGLYMRKTFENRIAAYREKGLGYRYEYALSLLGSRFRDTELARYLAAMFNERNATADVDTICEMFRALGETPPDSLFDGIRAPTLIISGSEDMAHEAAFTLARRIPHSELAIIEGGGHACNLDSPWAFDAHLLGFLARHGLFPGGTPPAARPSDAGRAT